MRRSVSSVGSLSSSGRLMSEWVFVEEAQCAIEKLLSKCRKGKKCCEMVLLCFRVSKVPSASASFVIIYFSSFYTFEYPGIYRCSALLITLLNVA